MGIKDALRDSFRDLSEAAKDSVGALKAALAKDKVEVAVPAEQPSGMPVTIDIDDRDYEIDFVEVYRTHWRKTALRDFVHDLNVPQQSLDPAEERDLVEDILYKGLREGLRDPRDIREYVQTKLRKIAQASAKYSTEIRMAYGNKQPEKIDAQELRRLIKTDPNFQRLEDIFTEPDFRHSVIMFRDPFKDSFKQRMLIYLSEMWEKEIAQKGLIIPNDVKIFLSEKIEEELRVYTAEKEKFAFEKKTEEFQGKKMKDAVEADPNFEALGKLFEAPFRLATEDVEALKVAEKKYRRQFPHYSPAGLVYLAYAYHELSMLGVEWEILEKYEAMALAFDRSQFFGEFHPEKFFGEKGKAYKNSRELLGQAVQLRQEILASSDAGKVTKLESELQLLFENLDFDYFGDKLASMRWLLHNGSVDHKILVLQPGKKETTEVKKIGGYLTDDVFNAELTTEELETAIKAILPEPDVNLPDASPTPTLEFPKLEE